MDCGYFGNKTAAERKAVFPFSVAKKVVLVAFPHYIDAIGDGSNGSSIDSLQFAKFFKIKETLQLPEKEAYYITEKIELSQDQINDLSNLMLNYKVKNKAKTLALNRVTCYSPRNAILFLDENDKVFSFVEICFECVQFYQQPTETIPDFNILCQIDECGKMIGLFKSFFKNNGIHYGVDER